MIRAGAAIAVLCGGLGAALAQPLYPPAWRLASPSAGVQALRAPAALAAEAYRLLAAGKPKRAITLFRALLRADSRSLAAHEGLAWTYLRLGEAPRAARHADRRRALAPGDEAWREKWLSIIRLVPARREEALRGYRALIAARPGVVEPRLHLAELLSWTKGRLPEAIAEYRAARSLAPADPRAREGLARCQRWLGQGTAHGFRLLEGGDVRGAEAIFRAALGVDPRSAAAHEGLTWTYLRLGDVPRAARHADRRRALAPGDEAWREKWLSVIRLVPARREEAIRGYRVLVADRPGAIEPRLRLAELLSWTKGRLGEAIAEYRRALALAPRDRAPRIGLARALAWDGRLAEATRRFDELIAKDPDDPEVLLGRGQIARWSGNRALARRLIERARAFGPKDARVLAELALLELEEGRRESARSAVREALALAPGQYEALQAQVALARARAATVAVRTVYSDESTSFQRFAVRVPLELRPFGGTWAMVEPVFTRFAAVGETLDRKSIGAEVRQNLPGRVQVRARYAAHFPDGVGATHEAGLELRAGPLGDVLELRAGGRQRALVDPPLGYEDVGLFAGMIGSGGATLAAIRERLQIREAHGGLSILPAPGAYVYGEVMYGAVGDGNRQIAAAAGMGLDFLRMAGVRGHELRLKYDFFLLDLTRASDRYFSPQGFQVHTPALEWRWTPAQGAVVGVEGGAPLARGAPPGYLGGILFGLSIRDRVRVEGRARLLDNTQYRIAAGTLGVAVGF